MEEKNNKGRPRRYLYLDTWKDWYEKEWKPLAFNDLPHIKTDLNWLKWLVRGIFIILLGLLCFQIWG